MPQRTPEACPRGESSGTLGRSMSVLKKEERHEVSLPGPALEIIGDSP